MHRVLSGAWVAMRRSGRFELVSGFPHENRGDARLPCPIGCTGKSKPSEGKRVEMKRIRIIGACLIASGAIGATASATASAEPPEVGRCVPAESTQEGKKTIYHGM